MSDKLKKKLKSGWEKLKERLNRAVNPDQAQPVPVLIRRRNRRYPI